METMITKTIQRKIIRREASGRGLNKGKDKRDIFRLDITVLV